MQWETLLLQLEYIYSQNFSTPPNTFCTISSIRELIPKLVPSLVNIGPQDYGIMDISLLLTATRGRTEEYSRRTQSRTGWLRNHYSDILECIATLHPNHLMAPLNRKRSKHIIVSHPPAHSTLEMEWIKIEES